MVCFKLKLWVLGVCSSLLARLSAKMSGRCPFSDLDTSVWDQRHTLAPPPFAGPMARLLQGLPHGDELFSDMSSAAVHQCIRDPSSLDQSPEPSWVEWDRVRQGQELWVAHLGGAFAALNAALLQGFSIARFADVLCDSGYVPVAALQHRRADVPSLQVCSFCKEQLGPLQVSTVPQGPVLCEIDATACNPLRSDTAWHISDWYRFPLNDRSSTARQSIYQVRAMHESARRRRSATQGGVQRIASFANGLRRQSALRAADCSCIAICRASAAGCSTERRARASRCRSTT